MGLDVIASDLEYVYQVIQPSLVFNPYDEEDIAEKIKQYLSGHSIKSKPIVKNQIKELINIIKE